MYFMSDAMGYWHKQHKTSHIQMYIDWNWLSQLFLCFIAKGNGSAAIFGQFFSTILSSYDQWSMLYDTEKIKVWYEWK